MRHKEWPHSYHVVKDGGGITLLYEKSPGIVIRVNKEHLADNIKQFTSAMPQEYWVTGDEAEKIAKSAIFDAAKLGGMPPTVRMKDDGGLAFHRIPLNIRRGFNEFKMPIFEEILSRCSNMEALCAFIGSIFVPDSDRQQYLWIHGRGRNSKGALLRLLRTLLGEAYHSDEVELSRDKYWTSGFVGKRLVAFPDCNSPCFPRSARFKALTGSDPIRIEGKYERAYSTILDCKFLFLSNDELIISDEEADTRRAIYVKMDPIKAIPIRDTIYDKMLIDEAEDIISFCVSEFERLSPNHGEVPTKLPAEVTELFEEQMLGMLHSRLEFGASLMCTRTEFASAVYSLGIKNPREVHKIKRFIFEKMGVTPERDQSGGKDIKTYHGVTVRQFPMTVKTNG